MGDGQSLTLSLLPPPPLTSSLGCMTDLDLARLHSYRAATFCLRPDGRLHTPDDARRYVNERGFIYFWPITGVEFPNLWAAVAGNRPVADEHDDPGHITWRWKDQALDKRWWYYAKILRGKATLIDLATAPAFYALSENYGEPEQDYRDQYGDGQLSHEAKTLYETLLTAGPLDTVNLRRQMHMTSQASNTPFESALVHLQRDFKILPVGVAETGAWRYSFIYECTHRWYPDLPAAARAISRQAARRILAGHFLRALGAARPTDLRKLFGWKLDEIEAALAGLAREELARGGCHLAGEKGEWWAWAPMLAA